MKNLNLENCIECGAIAETECESCGAALCCEDADTSKYEDVDVCANEKRCEKRCHLLLNNRTFCGCCGRECLMGMEWCLECAQHLLEDGPPWERTFFAQFNKDCPHQIAPGDRPRPPGKRMAA